MRHKVITVLILAVTLSAFAIAGAAQRSQQDSQDQTTQDQSKQDQSKPGTPGGGMMGQGMMGGDMRMGMTMGQMMVLHRQMTETMNKIMQSITAIQNEKDPAILKSKLAEHRALIEQMRNEMMQQGGMMQNMMQG
jgi:hypothetical protein